MRDPRRRSPPGPSTFIRYAGLASCAGLAACAAMPLPGPSVGFGLDSPVRELAASASASAPPERMLHAYALRIQTLGAGPEGRVDVLGRQAWLPDGSLVSVTGSQGAGVFGMSRSIGLCGLVSLRLDTALADRAYLPGDPARSGDVHFTDAARLEATTRMRATGLQVEGQPCAPLPGAEFGIVLQTRTIPAGEGAIGRVPLAAEVRYACRAGTAFEPANRLHPELPGEMLRVDCRRSAATDVRGGHLAYAWIASSGVYLLTGHRGQDIAQHYVYTDVVLGP